MTTRPSLGDLCSAADAVIIGLVQQAALSLARSVGQQMAIITLRSLWGSTRRLGRLRRGADCGAPSRNDSGTGMTSDRPYRRPAHVRDRSCAVRGAGSSP